MANKRYVETTKDNLGRNIIISSCGNPVAVNYNETLSPADIIKAEIENGSLKDLREKIAFALWKLHYGVTDLMKDNFDKEKETWELDSYFNKADTIISLLKGGNK